MALFEQINNDLKEAMKARDKKKLEALRNIKKVMIEARAAKGGGARVPRGRRGRPARDSRPRGRRPRRRGRAAGVQGAPRGRR